MLPNRHQVSVVVTQANLTIFFRLSAAIIMETVYGIEIAQRNDRYMVIAEESVKLVTESLFPGAALYNLFPARKF
jgi:hypothetical protein